MPEQRWPEADLEWLFAYLFAVTQPDVSSDAISQRVDELRDALCEAGEPAEIVFGSAGELGRADAAELGTPAEAIRGEGGDGARGALMHVGVVLTLLGPVVAVLLLTGIGWVTDVRPRALAVLIGIYGTAAGMTLGGTFLAGGRVVASVASVLAGLAAMAGGVIVGISSADAEPLLRDTPTLLLGFGALAPGLLILGIARVVPRPPAVRPWDEKRWVRRFAGALRARGMSASSIRDRERELRAALAEAGGAADYGDPVVMARIIAAGDPTSARRRWLLATVGVVGFPLMVVVAQIGRIVEDGWNWWSAIIAVAALALAAFLAVGQWSERPQQGAA